MSIGIACVLLLLATIGGVKEWPKLRSFLPGHQTQVNAPTVQPTGGPATPPSGAPSQQDLTKFSPDLAAYVASKGSDIGVQIFDVKANTLYGANQDSYFTLASSAKVNIMIAYLQMVEKKGGTLTSDETTSIKGMIEQSDNGDGSFGSSKYQPGAQPLYAAMGYATGQVAFYQANNLPYHKCDGGWGCAESTPAGIVQALSLLQQGKLLNSDDQKYALNLMSNIASDEQYGVGQIAPQGSTFYLKNGWAPNITFGGNYDINTTGWIVTKNDTWFIAIYTQNQPAWSRGTTPPDVVGHASDLIAKVIASK